MVTANLVPIAVAIIPELLKYYYSMQHIWYMCLSVVQRCLTMCNSAFGQEVSAGSEKAPVCLRCFVDGV